MTLFGQARDEISFLTSSEKVAKRRLELVEGAELSFIEALAAGSSTKFLQSLKVPRLTERFNDLADALEEISYARPDVIDRAGLTEQTLAMMRNISESRLDDYPKKALLVQMRAVVRICSEAELVSDDEIRLRVKSIFADFCAEFSNFDKEHEELYEKMKRWASRAACGSLFVLALTADVSAIAPAVENISAELLQIEDRRGGNDH